MVSSFASEELPARGSMEWEKGGLRTLRQLLSSAGRTFWMALLGLLAGCQISAVRYPAAAPDQSSQARALVLARQLVVDSSLELLQLSLRSTRQHSEDRYTLDPAAREERGSAPADDCLEPARVQLYLDGPEALAALHQVILQATCRIDVIMFLWEDDAAGRAIAAWLADRASSQLHVRVLVDGGGNLLFGRRRGTKAVEVNRVVAALAQQPNVEVLRTHNAFARFDHRKLLLADGQVAWTGGRNFVYRSFFEQHDLSFVMAGPLVHRLADDFERYWHEQGGGTVERGQSAEASEQPPTAVPILPTPHCPLIPNAWARLLMTEPAAHELEQELYQAVDQARQHIYLENVYFLDSRLLSKLAQARRRGADVRVVLTIASTNPVINWANRVVANRLCRAGVRVYLYPGMTHVKAGAIDGCWAYLGTGNFDTLSLRYNRETGIAIRDGDVIEELEEKLLLADCRSEWEMKEPLPASLADQACALLASLCL